MKPVALAFGFTLLLVAHAPAAAESCSGQVAVCVQSTCTGSNNKYCYNRCRVQLFQKCMTGGTSENRFVQTKSGLTRR
jgi:hypothetical protein